jgi:hypothetical protein
MSMQRYLFGYCQELTGIALRFDADEHHAPMHHHGTGPVLLGGAPTTPMLLRTTSGAVYDGEGRTVADRKKESLLRNADPGFQFTGRLLVEDNVVQISPLSKRCEVQNSNELCRDPTRRTEMLGVRLLGIRMYPRVCTLACALVCTLSYTLSHALPYPTHRKQKRCTCKS